MQTGRGPETVAMVELSVSQQESKWVDGITMNVCEVATILGDIIWIFCNSSTERAGVRACRGICLGTLWHVNSSEDGTRIGGAGIGTTAGTIGERHGLGNLEPIVHLVFAAVTDTEVLVESVDEDSLVVLVGESQTALVFSPPTLRVTE